MHMTASAVFSVIGRFCGSLKHHGQCWLCVCQGQNTTPVSFDRKRVNRTIANCLKASIYATDGPLQATVD